MKREEKMKVNTASIPPCSPPLCPSCLSVCLPCTQGLFMESNVTHATPSDSSLPGLLTAHTSLTFSTTPACTCMRAHTHTHTEHDTLPIKQEKTGCTQTVRMETSGML